MKTGHALGALAILVGACGGSTIAGVAADAAADADDAGGVHDGGAPFVDATDDGFGGFDAGAYDALAYAPGACDPPCADGEYCYAYVVHGGGRRIVGPAADGGDASLGCHAVPAACAPAATCACLLQVVGPACHASTTDCVVDDAGRPTVECILYAP